MTTNPMHEMTPGKKLSRTDGVRAFCIVFTIRLDG
jgi:hypothetical protein